MKRIIKLLAIVMILATLFTLTACGTKCDHVTKSYIIYDVNLYAYRVQGLNGYRVDTICFFTYKDTDGNVRSENCTFNEDDIRVGTINTYAICECGKEVTITLTPETLHNMDVYTK